MRHDGAKLLARLIRDNDEYGRRARVAPFRQLAIAREQDAPLGARVREEIRRALVVLTQESVDTEHT